MQITIVVTKDKETSQENFTVIKKNRIGYIYLKLLLFWMSCRKKKKTMFEEYEQIAVGRKFKV